MTKMITFLKIFMICIVADYSQTNRNCNLQVWETNDIYFSYIGLMTAKLLNFLQVVSKSDVSQICLVFYMDKQHFISV